MDEAQKFFLQATVTLHKCPNAGVVIEAMRGDDKALCGCGKANPKCPREAPGHHVVAFLEPATIEEYEAQGGPVNWREWYEKQAPKKRGRK